MIIKLKVHGITEPVRINTDYIIYYGLHPDGFTWMDLAGPEPTRIIVEKTPEQIDAIIEQEKDRLWFRYKRKELGI